MRICIDAKHLNYAINILKCKIPRCDDIFAELHDKKYFTVIDLKTGFWQFKLDEKSSFLTTLKDTQWQPGTVKEVGINPRSYVVADKEGSTHYLRNRKFLHKPVRYRQD